MWFCKMPRPVAVDRPSEQSSVQYFSRAGVRHHIQISDINTPFWSSIVSIYQFIKHLSQDKSIKTTTTNSSINSKWSSLSLSSLSLPAAWLLLSFLTFLSARSVPNSYIPKGTLSHSSRCTNSLTARLLHLRLDLGRLLRSHRLQVPLRQARPQEGDHSLCQEGLRKGPAKEYVSAPSTILPTFNGTVS